MPTPEGQLKQQVTRHLKKMQREDEPIEFHKVHGNAMQRKGEPDVDIIFCGVAVKLELKAPGGKLTPLQRHRLARYRDCGALAACCETLDEVKHGLSVAQRLQFARYAGFNIDKE